jgi:hypothetical protein
MTACRAAQRRVSALTRAPIGPLDEARGQADPGRKEVTSSKFDDAPRPGPGPGRPYVDHGHDRGNSVNHLPSEWPNCTFSSAVSPSGGIATKCDDVNTSCGGEVWQKRSRALGRSQARS